MLAYIVKRIVYVTPVALGVSIICFMLVHLAPGDPLTSVLPIDATAEQQAEMRAIYGFDRPLIVQYGLWLWKVLHADLGTSIASGRPVLTEVSRAVVNSLILASVATLIGFTFGTFFGFVAGYFRNSPLDKVASALSVFGVSVPHYWLGMVLVIIFSVQLNWLPATGAGPGGSGHWRPDARASALHHSAGDHDVGDPDGHHRAHGAGAGRRYPGAGIRAGAARQGPERVGRVQARRAQRRADRARRHGPCSSAICSAGRS